MINTESNSSALLTDSDDKNQMPQINDNSLARIEQQNNADNPSTTVSASSSTTTIQTASSTCSTNNNNANNIPNNNKISVNTAIEATTTTMTATTKIADIKKEESFTNSSTIDEIQSNNSNSSTIKNLTMCTSHESSDLSLMDSRSNGSEKRDTIILPTTTITETASPSSSPSTTSKINNKTSASPARILPPSSIVLSPYSSNSNDEGVGGIGCNGNSCTDDEFDEISTIFDKKFVVIEKWLRERAPQEIVAKLHATTDTVRTPKSPKLRTSSVTSDLFQQWLASSPVQVIA